MKTLLSLLFLSGFSSLTLAASYPLQVTGENVLTKKAVSVTIADPKKKGTVVVFLSAKCPCSDSHIVELKSLAEKYKDFEFVGVHSNIDESSEMTKEYIQKEKLPFPVIQDSKTQIADEFKANKTPHVFVLNSKGEIQYQGGVSDSRRFDNADKKFLREALEDLDAGKTVRIPNGRTLGCAITREDQHVW
jgi:peroxiredoxin